MQGFLRSAAFCMSPRTGPRTDSCCSHATCHVRSCICRAGNAHAKYTSPCSIPLYGTASCVLYGRARAARRCARSGVCGVDVRTFGHVLRGRGLPSFRSQLRMAGERTECFACCGSDSLTTPLAGSGQCTAMSACTIGAPKVRSLRIANLDSLSALGLQDSG